MNVKFYAREGKTDSKIQICVITDRRQTLKVSTKIVIPKGTWDSANQQVKMNFIGAEELNETLLQTKLDVLKQYRKLNLDGIVEWSELMPRLKNYIKTGKTEPTVTKREEENLGMEEAINQFIRVRSIDYKPETIRKYIVLQAVWSQFEEYRKKCVGVMALSYPVLEEFRLYLISVRKNRNDTVYKMLAALKSLIRWLIQQGLSIDKRCLELRQKVKSKYEIVTLTEEEITLLKDVRLNKALAIIRDCFLFQLYTGQRFSDMQQLSPEQIFERTWKFQSIKTGKKMYVPMVGWGEAAFDIALCYDFRFPKYASQYFNRALKKICKTAEINEPVSLKRFNGSKAITIKKPKYEFVSSHTARRSCVSQLLAKGVPPTIVMKLTGHSSIQTMMRYERTTNESLFNAILTLQ